MLVRHATCALTETVLFGRRIDAPLDARGRRQALDVARRLAALRPAALWSSPRRRARATAQAIGALCGLSVRVDARLDEADFGRWAGCTFAALAADPAWRRWNHARGSSRTPAGDDMAQIRRRIAAVLADVSAACTHGDIVLVTHAEPIRALLLHAQGRSDDEFAALPIAPASIHMLRAGAGGWLLEPADHPAPTEELLRA